MGTLSNQHEEHSQAPLSTVGKEPSECSPHGDSSLANDRRYENLSEKASSESDAKEFYQESEQLVSSKGIVTAQAKTTTMLPQDQDLGRPKQTTGVPVNGMECFEQKTSHYLHPEIASEPAVFEEVTKSSTNGETWWTERFEVATVPPFIEELGCSWYDLGLRLRIKGTVLSNIADENKYNRERCHAVITKWQMQQGKDATNGMFVNALQEIGRKDVAELLGISFRKPLLNLHVQGALTLDTSSKPKVLLCKDEKTSKKYLVRELDCDTFDIKCQELTEEHEMIDKFLTEFKERPKKPKKAKEEKIVKRLSVELENLTKELENVTSSQDIRDLQKIDCSAALQLDICCTVNDMFQRMFFSLRELVGDLGTCDNTWLVEKVREFTKSVRAEYSFVGEQIQRLEEKKADLKQEELGDFDTLKKMENRQRTQMGQLEKLFATIFKQNGYRKSERHQSLISMVRKDSFMNVFSRRRFPTADPQSAKNPHSRSAQNLSSNDGPQQHLHISEPLFMEHLVVLDSKNTKSSYRTVQGPREKTES